MQYANFNIASKKQTVKLGYLLAELLRPGDVVGLSGDLGAGKTTLAAAVAHGLEVPKEIAVTSPTFTLINEYMGRIPVYHMDLFRLSAPEEIYELGLWEYYDGDGVCLVEWCERFDDLWPANALIVEIGLGGGENRNIRAHGRKRGEELVSALVSRQKEVLGR
jgi:tRNA threonylcarbamoyladenosine biosynthesis protein TsaE